MTSALKTAILLLLLCPLVVNAQLLNPKFHRITIENGLPQNSGKVIFQDSRGILWFGTEIGVCRYDGHSFVNYTHIPGNPTSIANNYINSLGEDSAGNILIGTDGQGLDILNVHTGKVKHIRPGAGSLPDGFVFTTSTDADGKVWVGSRYGLSKVNTETSVIEKCISDSGNAVFCSVYTQGWIYMGCRQGFFRHNPDKNNLEPLFPSLRVTSLAADGDLVWITTDGSGLMNTNVKTGSFNTWKSEEHPGLSTNYLASVFPDDKGNVWIASGDSGLFYLDVKRMAFTRYIQEEKIPWSLASNVLRTVLVDAGGVVWAGTAYDGICYTDGKAKPFNHYYSDRTRQYFFRTSSPACASRDGRVWVGSMLGLYHFDPVTGECRLLVSRPENPATLSNSFVTIIMETASGLVWVGTDEGLNLYNPATEKFTRFLADGTSGLMSHSVWALLEDSRGRIWTGTWGGGLSLYEPAKKTFKSYVHDKNDKNTISSNLVIDIYESKDGKLWIGTWEGGLNRFDPETETFQHWKNDTANTNSPGFDIVMSVMEDSKGYVWLGMFGGGLDRFDPESGTFIHYTTENGLPSNTVFGTLEDKQGRIWISTSHGLSCLNPEDSSFRNYDSDDGLGGNEYSQHGLSLAPDGRLLFSSVNGIVLFRPDSIRDNLYRAPLVITGVKVFDSLLVMFPGDSLGGLDCSMNSLTFSYSALHYALPHKIQYRYRLEGFEEKWTLAGNDHEAKYTNLDAGVYTFWVQSTNCDGVWMDHSACVRFEIYPPFWQRTWFIVLCVLSGIVLLYTFVRLREMKLRRDKAMLEQKVAERTQEINEQKEEIESQRDEIEAQRDEIEAQRDSLIVQKDEIEYHHFEQTKSIRYAERIQQSMLPHSETLEKLLTSYFIIFKPRDIVSGDFYWVTEIEGRLIITVADCTGHGVPGAFMSMLGIAFLREIVTKEYITHPGVILQRLRKEVIRALRQQGGDADSKDGMDITLCSIDKESMNCEFAGANNSLLIVRKNDAGIPEIIELKADHMPVGYYEKMDRFSMQDMQLQKGDRLCLFSDGIVDQFGGPRGKKLKMPSFKAMLTETATLSIQLQKEAIEKQIEQWMKGYGSEYPQIDDILLMVVEV